MVVSEGLPATLVEQEQRMAADACHCGAATRQRVGRLALCLDPPRPRRRWACGFGGFAAFRIDTPRGVIGMFSLHFRSPRVLNTSRPATARNAGPASGRGARTPAPVRHRAPTGRGTGAQPRGAGPARQHRPGPELPEPASPAARRCRLARGAGRCGGDCADAPLRGGRKLPGCTRVAAQLPHPAHAGARLRQAAEDTVARFRRQCATEVRLEVEGYDNARPLP